MGSDSDSKITFRYIYYFKLIAFKEYHSLLKLFTGLAIAAFIAWKLTVASATNNASIPASTKTHQ